MLFNKRDEIITDPKSMAYLLQEQFSSVFSDQDCPNVQNPKFMAADITQPLTDEDFVISNSDEFIILAIAAISPDSGCGPDGVPVCLLKTCAKELSFFDDIMRGLLRGSDTDVIYLDSAKAFNKVDHCLLIDKNNSKSMDSTEGFLSDWSRFCRTAINMLF